MMIRYKSIIVSYCNYFIIIFNCLVWNGCINFLGIKLVRIKGEVVLKENFLLGF